MELLENFAPKTKKNPGINPRQPAERERKKKKKKRSCSPPEKGGKNNKKTLVLTLGNLSEKGEKKKGHVRLFVEVLKRRIGTSMDRRTHRQTSELIK